LKVGGGTIRRPAHEKQAAVRKAEKGGPANQKCGKKSIFADKTFTNLQL
jgi:hypothetical protein